jgi:hypothetical protein
MAKLAELHPPEFGTITDQLTRINLAFPTPQFSFPSDLFNVNLDALTNISGRFSGLLNNLPASLDDLFKDLSGEIKTVGQGSSRIGVLISDLITPFTKADSVFREFDSLTTLSTDLFPALLRLQEQPVDAAVLAQVLPITTLAAPLTTQIPSVLEPYLSQVQQVRSQINALIQPPVDNQSSTIHLLGGYQTKLEEIATLPLDSLTIDQLACLDESWIDELTKQITTFNQQAASTDLQTIQQGLEALPATLNAALDTALLWLSPQQLAQQSNFLSAALAPLANLSAVDFGSAPGKIQAVIQPLQELVDGGIETAISRAQQVVQTVQQAIATAKQAVVKVTALVTNVIDQLIGFIDEINFEDLLNQATETFQNLILGLNGIFSQVGEVIDDIYTFIRDIITQVTTLGNYLPLLAENFYQLLNQITAFLDNPQVKHAVQQARQGIDLVVQKLDDLSLKPVFDQVLTQVNRVKASLKAIDLRQLNAILKAALSAALALVREVIEPPTDVTKAVKEEYTKHISEPILRGVVQPVQQEIDSVVTLIQQLNPGTWVGQQLTPLYEQALNSINAFVDPNQLLMLLQPVSDFQTKLLQRLEAVMNPSQLLKPLLNLYEKIMVFVRSLNPDTVLTSLNGLLDQATQSLDNLGLEALMDTITGSITSVTDWISRINIDPQFLDTGIESLIATWMQKLKTVVTQMDLAGLQTLLQPLRQASATLLDQIGLEGPGRLELVQQIQEMVGGVNDYATQYGDQMSLLVSTWTQACEHLEGFEPPSELKSAYDALKIRLQSLNPFVRLANMTWLIDRMNKTATAILTTLEQIWQNLGDRLKQGRRFLEYLLDEQANGLKLYLNQTIDALINQSLKAAIRNISQSLPQFKGVIQSIRKLQETFQRVEQIPQLIQTLGASVIEIKDTLRSLNFNFLSEPLQRARDEILPKLEALNPEAILIVPLTQVYNQVLTMLKQLNPMLLFATVRGTITLTAASATAPIILAAGTELAATTPLGDEVWFKTLREETVPVDGQVEVPIQAMIADRSSNLVGVDGVTWRIPSQTELQATHTQPILSLITLVQEELLGLLQVLDPMQLIAEPLNDQYARMVELFDELGLATLLDAFLKKIEGLDQDMKAGLDQLGGALGGLISAMPL